MYTNLSNHGGDFKNILSQEFSNAKKAIVASGYASLDILNEFGNHFINIANKGGESKLLLGMAFYEGLSSKKLDFALELNRKLSEINNDCGVFVSHGRRYHGKVYLFENELSKNIYVGSSNFSFSGIRGNIECTVPIVDESQKILVENFINNLYSNELCLNINKAEISVPGEKIFILRNVENYWNTLQRYNPDSIDASSFPFIDYPLDRIVEKEKSNLNVYFGKGRLNNTNGKIIPRPWYEIELIANRDLTSNPLYPIGDFLAYTDDGYIIPMRTQGDYHKNIRSKQSLQLFGIWLKGKLERAGVLNKHEPVTLDTLEEYGNLTLKLYKMSEDRYYMQF